MVVAAGTMNRETLKCAHRGAGIIISVEILRRPMIDRVFAHANNHANILKVNDLINSFDWLSIKKNEAKADSNTGDFDDQGYGR